MRHRGCLVVLFIWVITLPAGAHTFPHHAEPRVGHRVAISPPQVRIWFDRGVIRGTIRVESADGRTVAEGATSVSSQDPRLLEIEISQTLPPGDYHVYYEVLDTLGHPNEGDYTFSVGLDED